MIERRLLDLLQKLLLMKLMSISIHVRWVACVSSDVLTLEPVWLLGDIRHIFFICS
jgi:hypothetical protein